MNTIETRARIGADGVLDLKLPFGSDDADREVVVTVRPADPVSTSSMTRAEWEKFIAETAGSWQGEPLVRPDQGEYEEREEL